MKVAVLHDFLDAAGGAERLALLLARHFDADFVTTNPDPKVAETLGFRDVRVVSLGQVPRGTPWRHLGASRAFARARLPGYDRYIFSGNWSVFAAKRHHPNLWYCNTPTRFFYDRREAMLARLSLPGRLPARVWTRAHSWLERRAVAHVDRIVANSHNIEARVRKYYGRASEIVYPPLETSRYRFERVGDFWLSVTRLYPEKRIDLELDIFRHLPEAKLTLVGGTAPGDRSDEYVKSLHPPPNVTFLGRLPEDELLGLYARCRGLVVTAAEEDFGLTPLEAMASGKCVVATDEGGYRETILPRTTGFLLPPRTEAFVDTIRGLDDATLEGMRAACQDRARAFDAAAFFQKMDDILARTA